MTLLYSDTVVKAKGDISDQWIMVILTPPLHNSWTDRFTWNLARLVTSPSSERLLNVENFR